MQKIVIEPHYLGSLEYFILLMRSDEVILEVCQHFTKQTYKNRCYILTDKGEMPLSVPVQYGNRTAIKDVRIDHRQSWVRQHWGAFYSAYGKAPFFEYFHDHFRNIWEKKHGFLVDLNVEMMTMCLKILQCDRSFEFTENFTRRVKTEFIDLREYILPKKSFQERKIYLPFPYTQTFGNNFVSNLSILDLIMCEGPQASEVLARSVASGGEQI
ncbi:WbqC family protein [Marinoscillum furvescens]|uniref:WbqC-like protein n=1 Tax=Marinoscillum furvescens DSM 4134 TaxID=1122208 RepID=A0A3D9L5X8_MARFU|nr:WbqC family protein [Marinoscillum furvescens]RED99832.1 WbqC-like protein [Marinoscillum furvescens DSM 4134]